MRLGTADPFESTRRIEYRTDASWTHSRRSVVLTVPVFPLQVENSEADANASAAWQVLATLLALQVEQERGRRSGAEASCLTLEIPRSCVHQKSSSCGVSSRGGRNWLVSSLGILPNPSRRCAEANRCAMSCANGPSPTMRLPKLLS